MTFMYRIRQRPQTVLYTARWLDHAGRLTADPDRAAIFEDTLLALRWMAQKCADPGAFQIEHVWGAQPADVPGELVEVY